MMKKTLKTLSVFILLTLVLPITINAKTISQMEKELQAHKQKLNDTEVQKAINKQSIEETNSKISDFKSQITAAESQIQIKTKESAELSKNIGKKNEEIKELMQYYQISSSGSAMLEYVMGAKSITDLIYRLSITEQISNYNKNQIKKMNDMIAENERIKEELTAKKAELAKLKSDLDKQVIVLNEKQSKLNDDGMSEAESIKEMEKQIKYYRSLGCSDTIQVSTCLSNYYANKGNSTYLPSGTTFYRPTSTGRMSSNYGWRKLFGKDNFHAAVDISMPTGTPVYATAPGYVAHTSTKGSGGNQMMVWHEINGKVYTSYYAHLSSFKVSVGTIVTKDTVIAKSGNTGTSTGPHLHFGIATGKWYSDYYNYAEFISHSIDPRSVTIFPAKGSSYSNR